MRPCCLWQVPLRIALSLPSPSFLSMITVPWSGGRFSRLRGSP